MLVRSHMPRLGLACRKLPSNVVTAGAERVDGSGFKLEPMPSVSLRMNGSPAGITFLLDVFLEKGNLWSTLIT